MSVADLPQCVRDCLKSVAKDGGCDANDLECFCTKEADPTVGITLGLCVAGNPFSLGSEESSSGCKDNALSLYGDLQAICQKGGFSSSSASAGSVGTATSNPPARTDSTNPSTGVTATPTSEISKPSPSSLSSQSPNSAETDNALSSGSTSSTSTSSGLSAGAAAGIGVGGAILAMLLALGLFLLWRKKRKQNRAVAESAEDESGAAEVSGKSAVRAEAPGSEPQYELYGQQTHTSELNSLTNGCNASPSPFTKEPESKGLVYELSADSRNAETAHER